MIGIETFKFPFGERRPRVATSPEAESAVMSETAISERISEHLSEEGVAAELEAYNRAFLELELSWRWDGPTFRDLLRIASDRDFVGAYIEHKQPHLLRV